MSQEALIINPPSQRGRHHAKSLTEVLELLLGKKLREIICDLVFCRKVLHLYCLPLHYTLNIMISLTNQICKEIMKPHCFADRHTQCNILCFCSTQGTKLCFLLHLGNHGKSQGKETPGGVLPIHNAPCLIGVNISLQSCVNTEGISQAISIIPHILRSRCLDKSIRGLLRSARMRLLLMYHEINWMLDVHFFLNLSMEKGCLRIHLM
jgi:hypothetical protein